MKTYNIKNYLYFMFSVFAGVIIMALFQWKETKQKNNFYKTISDIDTNSFNRLLIWNQDSSFHTEIKDLKKINELVRLLKQTSTNSYGKTTTNEYHIELTGPGIEKFDFIFFINDFTTLMFLDKENSHPLSNNYLKEYILDLQKITK